MKFSGISDTETNINKKRIITSFFHSHSSTIPELARDLNLSIPTVTKLINEMVEESIINDYGKGKAKVGRKPNTYGLNPRSGYFLGVDLKYNHLNIGLCDFNGEIIAQDFEIPFQNPIGSMELLTELCTITITFIKHTNIEAKKILSGCLNVGGRVNPSSGFSYSMFNFSEVPLSELLTQKTGIHFCIENDTRAMTYGEFLRGSVKGEKDVLFINLGWGLGMGMIINGELYEGKSGFAGELGHIHVFENERLCHCGKKGCLETEVSGAALHRRLVESVKEGKVSKLSQQIMEDPNSVSLNDIMEAIQNEDFLCIDLIEDIGGKLGQQIANMINIFNPELVVIGGPLSAAGEPLIQAIRQAVNKHSLKLVSNDSRIVCSSLNEKAGVMGACMTARRVMFENLG